MQASLLIMFGCQYHLINIFINICHIITGFVLYFWFVNKDKIYLFYLYTQYTHDKVRIAWRTWGRGAFFLLPPSELLNVNTKF